MGHQKLLSGELTKENLRIPADNDSSYGGNGGSTPPNYRPRADLDNDYYGGNGGSIPPDFGHPLAADDADLYDYRRKRRSRMESLVSGAIGNQSGLSTAGLQSGRELVVADPSSNTIRNLQERFEQKILEQERLGQERLEQERLEQERTEWLEQERLEQKRLEQPPSFGHPLADLDVVVEGPITCGSTSDSVHLPRQSGVLKSFKNTARKLLRPKPREDKQRIEWTCVRKLFKLTLHLLTDQINSGAATTSMQTFRSIQQRKSAGYLQSCSAVALQPLKQVQLTE
jgi:hypothetical protein